MPLNIDNDLHRFRQIVKGRVRKDLRRFMSSGEMLGKQGDKVVSIPIPQIDIPHFRYGKNQGGVGQGEGEEGEGAGSGREAGEGEGEHTLEVELTLEELAQILAEELHLPNIEPKGRKEIQSTKDRYIGVARRGPESLRHQRRTFKEALKRQVASGGWQPGTIIVPVKDDKRFRTWKARALPQSAAVVILMMDVSGSMGDKQKEVVRLTSFWIDTWLKSQYKQVQTRFIIHDATAKQVDRDTFFRTKESGGTLISSAYKLCLQLIEEEFPPEEWNIYPFHFSDGDNWSQNDTRLCVELVKNELLPRVNLFSYGQVDSEYGSGQFVKELDAALKDEPKLRLARIHDKDGIMDAIRAFLGKGG